MGVFVQFLILGMALSIGILRPLPNKEKPFASQPVVSKQKSKASEIRQKLKQMKSIRVSDNPIDAMIQKSLQLETFSGSSELSEFTFPAEMVMNVSELFNEEFNQLEDLSIDTVDLDFDSEVEFMGIETKAQRVLFAIDVSSSVKSKVDQSGIGMLKLKEEVKGSIEDFGVGQLFAIVQFSRKWDFYDDKFVPGTNKSKKAAKDWLDKRFKTNGTSGRSWKKSESGQDGFIALLDKIFSDFPAIDLLIIVSDGDFQQTRVGGGYFDIEWRAILERTRKFQSSRIKPFAVRFVGFCLETEIRKEMHPWVSEFDGEVIEFKPR